MKKLNFFLQIQIQISEILVNSYKFLKSFFWFFSADDRINEI